MKVPGEVSAKLAPQEIAERIHLLISDLDEPMVNVASALLGLALRYYAIVKVGPNQDSAPGVDELAEVVRRNYESDIKTRAARRVMT